MRAQAIACVVLVTLTAAPSSASADGDVTISAEATVDVVASDLARARDKALRRALEEAVLAAARRVVGEPTFVAKEKEIRARILLRAASFVSTYKVTREAAADDEMTVAVEAVVSTPRLRTELRSMSAGSEPLAPASHAALLEIRGTDSPDTIRSTRAALEALGYAIVETGAAHVEDRVELQLLLEVTSEPAGTVRGTSVRCERLRVRWRARLHTSGPEILDDFAEEIGCGPDGIGRAGEAATSRLSRALGDAVGELRVGERYRLHVSDFPNTRILLRLLDRIAADYAGVRLEEVAGSRAVLSSPSPGFAELGRRPPPWLASLGVVSERDARAPLLRFVAVTVELRAPEHLASGLLRSLAVALRALPDTTRVTASATTPEGHRTLRVWHPGGTGAVAGALSTWTVEGSPVTPRTDGDDVIVEVLP